MPGVRRKMVICLPRSSFSNKRQETGMTPVFAARQSRLSPLDNFVIELPDKVLRRRSKGNGSHSNDSIPVKASAWLVESGGVSDIFTQFGSFSVHRRISWREKRSRSYRFCFSGANRSSLDRSSVSECSADHVLPSDPRRSRWNHSLQRSNYDNVAEGDHSIFQIYVESR